MTIYFNILLSVLSYLHVVTSQWWDSMIYYSDAIQFTDHSMIGKNPHDLNSRQVRYSDPHCSWLDVCTFCAQFLCERKRAIIILAIIKKFTKRRKIMFTITKTNHAELLEINRNDQRKSTLIQPKKHRESILKKKSV